MFQTFLTYLYFSFSGKLSQTFVPGHTGKLGVSASLTKLHGSCLLSRTCSYAYSPTEMPRVSDSKRLFCPPPPTFWETFPKNTVPKSAKTPIDVEKFAAIIDSVKKSLTIHQISRAQRCISYLETGAPAFQLKKTTTYFL